MKHPRRRRLSVVALALMAMLAGCTVTTRKPEAPPQAEMLAAQAGREAALAESSRWTLIGRIAVADGKQNGSGRVVWRQDGERFRIELSAPVSRRSWRLSGDERGARLEGLDEGTLTGPDADALLAEAAGWPVPLADLRAWARGARAEGKAELDFGTSGLPETMHQRGWRVEYRDWFGERTPPLPRKVFAYRGDARVRLVVDRWVGNDP